MALATGTRLGPYEVVAALGAGGMGEVYRATDTDLKRQVALKVLPESFADDASRLARFQREAELLAALNHPHIAHIYGLARGAGVTALVMELVEGEDLAARIRRGPLPPDEALAVVGQIAEALEAAHDQAIVHRDLKPSNVLLRHDGTVKVLDFGLAKTLDTNQSAPVDSPTITSPAMTAAGVILGTAAYMAPEQAKGKPVDRRADLWALGAVLFEMLTGQRAFQGEDTTDTIVAVLSKEPDWSLLPVGTPALIRRLLRRCLQKDRRKRLDSAAVVRLEIDDARIGGSDGTWASVPEASPIRRGLPWLVAVIAGAALIATLVAWAPWRPDPVEPETRLDIVTPGSAALTSFALSPNGRQIAFAAAGDSGVGLWMRDLADSAPKPLRGTEGATYPFWSPDGRSLGFFAAGTLKRVDLGGGAPQTLARAPAGRGGAWHADGSIIFSPDQSSPLMRVSATGGDAVPATRLEPQQRSHRFPHLLPSGREMVYRSDGAIHLKRLDTETAVLLTQAESDAVYMPPGWLVWVRRGALVAQRLDLAQARLVGELVTIADGVAVDLGHGAVAVASNGILAYRLDTLSRRQLTWVDRGGAVVGAVGAPDANNLRNPRIAPDGRRVAAIRTVGGNTDIWLFEGSRTSRVTFDDALDMHPTWSADSSRMAFMSTRSESRQADLYQLASGSAGDQPLVASSQTKTPNAWSPDGRFLLFHSTDPQTGNDLWILPPGRSPLLFLKTPFREGEGTFSPDGRWVAYMSDQSGRSEVYVRPFTASTAAGGSAGDGGREWPVSTAGGLHPTWSPNGREVYYLSPAGEMMAVTIEVNGSAVVPGTPTRLFQTSIFGVGQEMEVNLRQYDVAPDGRFLINTMLDTAVAPITLLMNWTPDVKK